LRKGVVRERTQSFSFDDVGTAGRQKKKKKKTPQRQDWDSGRKTPRSIETQTNKSKE